MSGALRLGVRSFGELCITVGLLLLLFVAWQLWWTDVVSERTQARITDDLATVWAAPAALPVAPATPEPAAPAVPLEPPPPAPEPGWGEAFAVLRVPAFGAGYAVPVLQGTSLDVLEDGIGHYKGTGMPGAVGNFAVAGHRVTYGRPFNRVEELTPGDPVVVETREGWFVYRVRDTLIVTPDRVDVIEPVPQRPGAEPTERLLTLTTCHPMFSARERYIVHAVFDTWQPRAAGAPVALAG